VYETHADLPDGLLFPGERAIVARAVPGRALEFTTGRQCAREALARLGIPPEPILRDGLVSTAGLRASAAKTKFR
jgi:4'-phosphopantetheinyl transferase EntD